MSSDESIWEQLSKLQNRVSKDSKNLISLDELILITLAAQPDKPIYGKTMFMKQIFVIYEEIFKNKSDFRIQDGEYYPYKFGPFSDKVVDTTNDLVWSGNMEIINPRKNAGAVYKLTPNGVIRGKILFNSLPKNYQDDLKEYRMELDELGNDGILNYVYHKYDQYTIKSTIKEKHKKTKWGVINDPTN